MTTDINHIVLPDMHVRVGQIPLRRLFTQGFIVDQPMWDYEFNRVDGTIRPPTAIPDKLMALAMPSVATTFNRNPPAPRLIATDSAFLRDLNERYSQATAQAYEGPTYSNKALGALLRHRVYADRTEPALTG